MEIVDILALTSIYSDLSMRVKALYLSCLVTPFECKKITVPGLGNSGACYNQSKRFHSLAVISNVWLEINLKRTENNNGDEVTLLVPFAKTSLMRTLESDDFRVFLSMRSGEKIALLYRVVYANLEYRTSKRE